MARDSTHNSSSKPDRKSARSEAGKLGKGRAKGRDAQATPSVFAADMSVEGNVASGGDLYIDGVVIGDVRGRSVVIGESGRIEGELESESVTVHGKIQGTLRARDVGLSSTAHIDGDLYHETLEIERGASIAGQIHQQSAKAPEPTPEAPPKGQPLKVIQGESGDSTAGTS